MAKAFDKMIKKATVSPEEKKAKKNEAPTIVLPDELAEKLKTFNEEKKKEKEAESLKRTAEAPILQFCKDHQDKEALAGNFNGSYNVKGGTELVKFISQDSFSVSSDEEVQDQLRELLGDQYDAVIEEDTVIKMKDEVFQSEELQQQLVDKMGDDFAKFFDTISTAKVKDGFDERLFRIAGSAEKLEQIRTLITQKKPSLR